MVGWIMVWLSVGAYAQAPAAGSADEVWISGSTASAGNVSLTGALGDLWYANEWVNPSTPTDPALTVMWYDSAGPTFNAKTLQSVGDLTGAGIYPSIMTTTFGPDVYVVGKIDPTGIGTAPHLRIHTQDRDTFATAHTTEQVAAEGSLAFSIPHLRRDSSLPEEHLCYTAKDNGTNFDDVRSKPKDAADWLTSTQRLVANSTDIEDHCMLSFNYNGRRYAVYHRGQAGSTDPDIWLELTDWDGTTWTPVAEFGLTDSAGLDFPSLWIHNGGTTGEIAVAAHSTSTGNTALWKCGPATAASCDSAGDFGSPQAFTTTGNRKWPQVFIVPRSTTTDTFVLVENDASKVVRLLSICGGTASSFADEGALPLPSGYNIGQEQHMGLQQFWAHGQVTWDGTEFHAAYLVEKPNSNPKTYNIARYHAAPSALCP